MGKMTKSEMVLAEVGGAGTTLRIKLTALLSLAPHVPDSTRRVIQSFCVPIQFIAALPLSSETLFPDSDAFLSPRFRAQRDLKCRVFGAGHSGDNIGPISGLSVSVAIHRRVRSL